MGSGERRMDDDMRAMVRLFCLAGAAMSLTSCDSGTVTAENASTAEVAAKVKLSGVADEVVITPGRWRTTMTINDIAIPGMPTGLAGEIKKSMAEEGSFEHCVTPEDAKRPKEGFFAGEQARDCRYEKFEMGGGKIDMLMHCAGVGGRQTLAMNGTYSPQSYRMTVASNMGAAGSNPVTFNATMDSRRVGVCTGKEE